VKKRARFQAHEEGRGDHQLQLLREDKIVQPSQMRSSASLMARVPSRCSAGQCNKRGQGAAGCVVSSGSPKLARVVPTTRPPNWQGVDTQCRASRTDCAIAARRSSDEQSYGGGASYVELVCSEYMSALQTPSSLALDQAVDVGCGRWAIWLGVLANTITYMGDMGSTPRSSVELECPHSTAPDFN